MYTKTKTLVTKDLFIKETNLVSNKKVFLKCFIDTPVCYFSEDLSWHAFNIHFVQLFFRLCGGCDAKGTVTVLFNILILINCNGKGIGNEKGSGNGNINGRIDVHITLLICKRFKF